jgi:3-oxoacyl-[acyl-carrier-protein] synthase-3
MRWNDIYRAATGSYLPSAVETAEQAVAAGRYSQGERVGNGFRAVRTATAQETGPVMAAAAARTAMTRAGVAGEDVGLTIHACVGHQGQEFWTPVNYVHQEAIGGNGLTVEIRQGSNGGLAGLELAASHLAARGAAAAVVTTGDAFRLPYFDRWASDSQQVYGDGAGALVLSSQGGFARLVSTVSLTDSALEPIYRGSAWTAAPFENGKPVDLASRKSDYLRANEDGYEEVIGRMASHAATVLDAVLDEADTKIGDINHFVHANIAQTIVGFAFHSLLGVKPETTPYDWGLDFGHMGAGDQIIGIDHLAEIGALKPGQLVATMGVGTGFMWTAAVLEILEAPQW